MSLYFFHLNFGHRVLPDEEGVELPNRSAAREEALAVVRDLADPKIGGNTRRWASWFLQVADDEGQFFRTPIGHSTSASQGSAVFARGHPIGGSCSGASGA